MAYQLTEQSPANRICEQANTPIGVCSPCSREQSHTMFVNVRRSREMFAEDTHDKLPSGTCDLASAHFLLPQFATGLSF
jgi:hypothetical protein